LGIFKPNIEKLAAKKNIKSLIRALKHDDKDIRLSAIEALGKIQDSRAIDPLIQMLGQHKGLKIYRNAVIALANMGEPAFNSLINVLRENDFSIRMHAAEALGLMRDRRAVEPLIHALKDKVESVRGEAVRALGEIGNKRAVEALMQMVGDNKEHVRHMAYHALEKSRIVKIEMISISKLGVSQKLWGGTIEEKRLKEYRHPDYDNIQHISFFIIVNNRKFIVDKDSYEKLNRGDKVLLTYHRKQKHFGDYFTERISRISLKGQNISGSNQKF